MRHTGRERDHYAITKLFVRTKHSLYKREMPYLSCTISSERFVRIHWHADSGDQSPQALLY